ncbi:Leucine-rich repeat transmembrane neuronal protein 4 [Triplophysa tibetana]|uniref:Leucine-rich repeat transmembrane neuronal protein 4 n=1 Tax=Triplophysa tibetana TaxID=1572043 RepID=A0A5A9N3P1_9TELE|nr:Leucine-rich repeat transmembrane neuronal protein 4 [Triplophysa tibetana]
MAETRRSPHTDEFLQSRSTLMDKRPSNLTVVGHGIVIWVPHQMSTLTFYRYEQPIVDYCQAHQPLRLNMSYEGPPQSMEGLEELPPRERSTIQTVALPAVPTLNKAPPGPCSPPSQRAPVEGPSISYPTTERSVSYPTTERSTSTLTFRR